MPLSLTTHTHTHTYTWPGIQSEDTIYTRVYSVFVPAFKARTNLCITHSKWGHFFTHLWTCLARTKRGLRPYPPTPILWQREDSAHSHKARTEILTSLCQNVLTLNVKNWFWSSLWMPGRTLTHTPSTHTHTPRAGDNTQGRWLTDFTWKTTLKIAHLASGENITNLFPNLSGVS